MIDLLCQFRTIKKTDNDYSYTCQSGHSADTAGSDFIDVRDWCDVAEDTVNRADNCIIIGGAATDET